MHNLNHKDYLFLIFVSVLMIFVTGVFWLNWKGVNVPNGQTTDSVVSESNKSSKEKTKLTCGGKSFLVSLPTGSSVSAEDVASKTEIDKKVALLNTSGFGYLVYNVPIKNFSSVFVSVSGGPGLTSLIIDCYTPETSFGSDYDINNRIESAINSTISDEKIKVVSDKISNSAVRFNTYSKDDSAEDIYWDDQFMIIDDTLFSLNTLSHKYPDESKVDVFFNSFELVNTQNSAQDASLVDDRYLFDCGEKFYLNQPVTNFEFENPDSFKHGILNACLWTSKEDTYEISYIKQPHIVSIPEMKQFVMDSALGSFGKVRELNNGFEVVVYSEDTKLYSPVRALAIGDKMIILGMNFNEKTTLDNPEFRSFVESFRLVE